MCRRRLNLYEIPITLISNPSRKYMRQVAPRHSGGTECVSHFFGSTWCPPVLLGVRHATRHKEHPMLDLILIALGLGFFALSVAYVYACDRL